jgi:hypothetical protein
MSIPQRGRNISDRFRDRNQKYSEILLPLCGIRMTMLSPGYLNRLNQL